MATEPRSSVAGDLLSAACLAGDKSLAKEAAEFVVSMEFELGSSHPLVVLAHSALSPFSPRLAIDVPLGTGSITADEISTLRARLSAFPRNAIGWVDLALLFASRGLGHKARRTMLTGLSLAPNNRFVLRSASRLFLHLGELDFAHNILRESVLARFDPWVCASEVAVATATGKNSRAVDFGIEMLRREKLGSHETSELSSALGMLEFADGSSRNARKHIRNSLIAPNENSLAQARFLAQDMPGLQFSLAMDDGLVARPFEAAA